MPIDISREHRIFLALWRKAIRGEAVRIECASDNQAITTRLAMYRALKPFRKDEFEDPELFEAGRKLGIRLEGSSLVITEKQSTISAEAAMLQFGLSEDDLLTPEELVAKEQMEKSLQNFLEREETLTRKNEFY